MPRSARASGDRHMSEDIDETILNRKIARKLAGDAASKGDPIAGALAELENAALPFYLGVDADENSEDMDVYP